LISISAFAGVLDLIENAKKNNLTFLNAQINFEQSKMDYERNISLATTQKDLLSAKQSYLTANQDYQDAVLNHISLFFNKYVTYIKYLNSYQIALNNLELAKKDLAKKQDLLKKGLVTQSDLNNAKISVQENQLSLDQVKYNLDNAKQDLIKFLGTSDVPKIDFENVSLKITIPNINKLLEKSLEIQIAQNSLDIANFDFLNASSDTSAYDLVKYKNNVQIAQNNLNNVKNSTLDSFNNDIFTLKSLQSKIEIQKSKLQLIRNDLSITEQKYKKGLISDTEYYNAQNNYYTNLSTYFDSVLDFVQIAVKLNYISEGDYAKIIKDIFKE